MQPTSAWASLFWKVFGTHFGVVAVLVTAATVYFPRRHLEASERALEAKATAYAAGLAEQLEGPLLQNDAAAARELFEWTAKDVDVAGIALFAADGRPLATFRDGAALVAPTLSPRAIVETQRGSRRVRVPVVAREGPPGTLVLEVSTERLARDATATRAASIGFGLVALLVGGAITFALARSIPRRVGDLARAARAVAAGDLSASIEPPRGHDEIDQLATAFAAMLAQLRRLVAQIEESAATEAARLEAIVDERTAALTERNAELRLVLDHVDQGFATVDRAGRMGPARSAALDRWLGLPRLVDEPFAEYLDRVDPELGRWFALGYEQLLDDVMPREVSLASLPHGGTYAGRDYRFAYTPIDDERRSIARLLVVVTDVTEANAFARAEERRRESHDVLERAFVDTRGFFAFHRDAERIIGEITSGALDLVATQRALHTLKGNAGLFGLGAFGNFCHHLEGRSRIAGHPLAARDREQLVGRWRAATAPVVALFSSRLDRVEVDSGDLDALVAAILGGATAAELAATVRSFRFEPFEQRLRHLGDRAVAMAAALGKHDVVVTVDGGGVRFDATSWTPFWSALVHAIRNAVDHGLEGPLARERAEKEPGGLIELRASADAARLTVVVRDDGRGIEWPRVAKMAIERGLPARSRADLVEALFADGVSTAEEVTETSGRGLGMAALREACRQLGGEIEVESAAGAGTALRFVFARARLGDSIRVASGARTA